MVKRVIARSHDETYFLEKGLGCKNDESQRMRGSWEDWYQSFVEEHGGGAVLEPFTRKPFTHEPWQRW